MLNKDLPLVRMHFALIPLAGIVVIAAMLLVAYLVRKRAGHKPALMRSTVAWTIPHVAALAFMTAYICIHLVMSHAKSLAGSVLLIVVAAAAVVAREWVLPLVLGDSHTPYPRKRRAADQTTDASDASATHNAPAKKDDEVATTPALEPASPRRAVAHVLLTVVAIAAMTLFSTLALEKPISPAPLSTIAPAMLAAEMGLIALLGLAVYLLFGRHGGPVAILPTVLLVFGLANFFVSCFKHTVIVPSDILAINTAAEVAASYTYTISDLVLRSIAFACLAWAVCSYLVPTRHRPCVSDAMIERVGERGFTRRQALLMGVGATAGVVAAVTPNWRDHGVVVDYWNPKARYCEQGSLTSFVAEVQDIPIPKPSGYSDKKAQALLASYAQNYDKTVGTSEARKAAEKQFDEQRPSVVIVMNETFADLSLFDKMHCGYEGPQFFRTGMADGTIYGGQLAVSVNGGGTCNTEFECLTGESMLYAGVGKYPYNMYNFAGVANVARQLGELGYKTTAMHPNVGTNWHRNTVYRQFGFDEFLTIEDFPDDAPRFHSGLTDKVTYDKVLEVLRSGDEPHFVFDVTMQNHSGYDQNNIPADRLTHYKPANFDDADTDAKLNEYLSCIQASDEDLEYFIGELQKLDRPVVLLFFGDHQPDFTGVYNDAWYEDANTVDHAQRIYQTNYRLWANYEVAGAPHDEVAYDSACYLSSVVFDTIGAPLTDFQKAQIVAREKMPALDAFGVMGADGKWHATDDASSPVAKTSDDMAQISYLNFATKVN